MSKIVDRIPCSYCGSVKTEGYIKRHEDSCYLNPINLRLCEVCDAPIKNFKTSATCGYSCSNTKFRSGPNHPNWTEDRYQTTCFHYHEKKCVVCPENKIVTVHHLDEDHNNNSPENLIPLCPTHHQYVHSRYRNEVQPIIDSYIDEWKSKR